MCVAEQSGVSIVTVESRHQLTLGAASEARRVLLSSAPSGVDGVEVSLPLADNPALRTTAGLFVQDGGRAGSLCLCVGPHAGSLFRSEAMWLIASLILKVRQAVIGVELPMNSERGEKRVLWGCCLYTQVNRFDKVVF